METLKYSVVVPVYKNEESISDLLSALTDLSAKLGGSLEAVFVVDGSPDQSYRILEDRLRSLPFPAQLLAHSRNFGSFAAIQSGLEQARGAYCCTMAADLQEPIAAIEEIFRRLEKNGSDVIIGVRRRRSDPLLSRLASNVFWSIYRRWIQPEMPKGGVDLFGCTQNFRKHLQSMAESNTTLVGLVVWMGFRRSFVEYDRQSRPHGRSAWTFSRKLRYMMDSLFAFSDLPITLTILAGTVGMVTALSLGLIVLIAKLTQSIQLPGYTATILTIIFFGGLNLFSLGIIGSYVWRAFENTKGRPRSIVMSKRVYP